MTEWNEQQVSEFRKELGEQHARDGLESAGDHSSEEFKQGYKRGEIGWGSNVTPRKFGKGGHELTPWKCVCGQDNKRYLKRCWLCNQSREYSEDK
jgi:hypothetical protein